MIRSRRNRIACAALAALLLATPPQIAFALGPEGHEVIALLAEQRLTPQAKKAVDALLALEPGETLASISTWADRTRDKSTAAWHYVNLPHDADCNYVAPRDCPGGNCVVGALEAQVHRLRSSSSSPVDRLEALKWVVHLVGDLHQPLHVGFADDKGGNTYQLQAFGRGTNLHQLWDSGLIRDIDPNARSLADKLTATAMAAAPAQTAFAPAQWARESCRIVSRADFYPERSLPDAYRQAFEPVVRQQLYAAGQRLAATLNQVFAASAVSDNGSARRPIAPAAASF